MAAFFGAGFATDAFNVAFRVPNLLRDLFAEGALSAAFIPTFTATDHKAGRAEAWRLGAQVMNALALALLFVTVVGWFAMPWLVPLLAPGFASVPGKLELTVLLSRVMLPFLLLIAVAAAAMGMLNAVRQFTVPALAPLFLNLGMIVVGLGLIPVFRALGQPPILAMAIGVLAGGFLQFAVQVPALWKLGWRPAWPPQLTHPGVRRIAFLMLPATIGLAATQLNIFVNTILASQLIEGSVSWLSYAFRLMQLPIGVFGIALATVSMPALSRAAVNRDLPALKGTLSATVRLVLLMTVPAAVFLAVLSQPIIALLFEHGRFHADATAQTSAALVMYCIGLPAFASIGVLTRTFYALGDTRTPMQASLVSVALNLALNLLLVGPLRFLGLEHRGLALAASVTAVVNLLQLSLYLRRKLGPLEGGRIAGTLLRVAAASALVGVALWLGLGALAGRWHHGPLVELGVVLAAALVAGLLGWGALRLARVEELGILEELARGLARRLGWR